MTSQREGTAGGAFIFGPSALARVTFLCVLALAANAVIIQTVVTDESSPLKLLVRIGVMISAVAAVFLGRVIFPPWVLGLTIYSASLLLIRSNPDQLSYIFVFLLVPLLWSISERQVLRSVAIASLISLALIFVLLALGITQNITLEYRSRATFGTQGVPFFLNVVYGAASLSVLYVFKYKIRHRFKYLFVVLVATTYLFQQTDGRGGYFSFLAFVALLVLVPLLARSTLMRVAISLIPIGCITISFVIASLWRNRYYDQLFSYRPQLLHAFLNNLSWDDFVFSTSVKNFSDSIIQVRTVDNSYLHLLVGGGVVLAIAYSVFFASATLRLFKLKRHGDIAFLIATSLYFNSESILLRVENLFVIYSWYLVLGYCRWGAALTDLDSSGEKPVHAGSPR